MCCNPVISGQRSWSSRIPLSFFGLDIIAVSVSEKLNGIKCFRVLVLRSIGLQYIEVKLERFSANSEEKNFPALPHPSINLTPVGKICLVLSEIQKAHASPLSHVVKMSCALVGSLLIATNFNGDVFCCGFWSLPRIWALDNVVYGSKLSEMGGVEWPHSAVEPLYSGHVAISRL